MFIGFGFKLVASLEVSFCNLIKNTKFNFLQITFKHSHQIQVAEAFSYLRMTNETKQLFWTYFNEGMTPSCAKSYHELSLEQNENDVDFIKVISNTQINPNDRQVYILHDEWR